MDGSRIPAALTPDPLTQKTKFDMLSYATGQWELRGKEFKLDWTLFRPDNHAQVEWIEIGYQKVLTDSDCLKPISIVRGELIPSKNNLIHDGLTLHKSFFMEFEIFVTNQDSV